MKTNILNGTSHHEAPRPCVSPPHVRIDVPSASRLLSPPHRPATLLAFLKALGDEGLAIAYVDGEPALIDTDYVSTTPLRSLRLLSEWEDSVRVWGIAAPVANRAEVTLGTLDSLWAARDSLGRRLSTAQRGSVKWFLSQLSSHDVAGAIGIAADKIPEAERVDERFRYFCGVCHGKIRERKG